ncbi:MULTISPECIES: hypothetical protein [Paracoccus]|uniref:Uncharacterized protein n=1 Tax=Paracoccus versutus TaxID=34007 RepID=A0A3D9XD14_PARVE|nr:MULTISPECIES: hypothetical protein [Paracoccus]RQP05457.1 MAG: hypothetical protein D1H97_12810 [Paracoccus sp. BP8]MDK8873400.1 hypothetical protein [Paracoccus sp. SSJ]REF68294.1 hypothetical protein BDD41_3333 [Paracoccus versutus]RNI16140.1 hypothetical protein EB844_14515 [Paracoccus pantotrophus]WGR58957.1 hypothetical protein E3U25_24115 [Paracoccus versutus]
MNHPTTVTELMAEAANALIRRDPHRLEELERITRGWMQTSDEELAQIILLQAMTEAADLLLDTPSEIESA